MPLYNARAPALPTAPAAYNQKQQDQFSYALRLYFNRLDGYLFSLSDNQGGAILGFPCIGASDSTDQYASANDTATIVKWNTLDFGNGFTLNPAFTATAGFSGYYKIDYSLQLVNTDNTAHDVTIWLRVNGTDVAGSASKITVPARKSTGNPSYMLAYSTVPFQVDADDEIGLWWATDKAYSTTGPVDGVYILHEDAWVGPPTGSDPYTRPSIPSAIGAITFVSAVPT